MLIFRDHQGFPLRSVSLPPSQADWRSQLEHDPEPIPDDNGGMADIPRLPQLLHAEKTRSSPEPVFSMDKPVCSKFRSNSQQRRIGRRILRRAKRSLDNTALGSNACRKIDPFKGSCLAVFGHEI